jgi:hypothetical protein
MMKDVNILNKKSGFISARKLLAIVVVIGLIMVAVYAYQRYQDNIKADIKSGKKYSQSLDQLETASVKNTNSGGLMSYQKPANFSPVEQPYQTSNLTAYNSTFNSDGQTITNGLLVALSTQSEPSFMAIYSQALTSLASQNAGSSYSETLSTIQNLVESAVGKNYKVSLSKPAKAELPNIKSNVWTVDFNASCKDAKNPKKLPDMQGRAIIAIGKASIYYFVASATTYDWQNKQSVWQQVINSVKVDQ